MLILDDLSDDGRLVYFREGTCVYEKTSNLRGSLTEKAACPPCRELRQLTYAFVTEKPVKWVKNRSLT